MKPIIDYHTKCPKGNKVENLSWVNPNKRITVKDKPKPTSK